MVLTGLGHSWSPQDSFLLHMYSSDKKKCRVSLIEGVGRVVRYIGVGIVHRTCRLWIIHFGCIMYM